jgi:hypothetical protein
MKTRLARWLLILGARLLGRAICQDGEGQFLSPNLGRPYGVTAEPSVDGVVVVTLRARRSIPNTSITGLVEYCPPHPVAVQGAIMRLLLAAERMEREYGKAMTTLPLEIAEEPYDRKMGEADLERLAEIIEQRAGVREKRRIEAAS